MSTAEPMLDFVCRKLEEWRGRRAEVSSATGISIHTLNKIAQGQVDNPRIQTLQPLHNFFVKHPAPSDHAAADAAADRD